LEGIAVAAKIAIDVTQHPKVEEAHRGAEGFKFLMTLYRGTLEKKFRNCFGDPTKSIPKTPAIRVWEQSSGGYSFNILTNETGTRYDILYPGTTSQFQNDDAAGEACVAFLEDLYAVLTASGG
jgi:hypothetical protein